MLTTLLDGRAFAERFGRDPATVVALHGWGRSRSDWSATLEGRDALALDLPGFGATPAPPGGWSTAEYAEWVARVLEGQDRPVLVGHSFGGRVALQLAARRPELVRGLVLTGVPLFRREASGKPKASYRLARWMHRRGMVSAQRMEALKRRHGSADYRAAEGVMREVLVKAVNEEYADQLAAVARTDLPVALVWGEHDSAAPPDQARRALAVLGERASLEVVAGSAHLLDDPLAAALRSAIARLV